MSSKIDSAMPVDQDGNRILYTGVEVYVETLEKLHIWMRANSMAMGLETDFRQIPKRPARDVIRHVDEGRARSYERKEVSEW